MPAIIELRLCPENPPGGSAPTTRQLHGLACHLFEKPGSEHTGQFTVWPLRRAGDAWLLRAAWLRNGFPATALAGGGQVRLGHHEYTVSDVALRPVTHAELASVPPAEGARLTLLSPTYFKNADAPDGELDTRLLVRSWCDRWNASLPPGSPMLVVDELRRDIHLSLHVTGSGLRTESRDTGYRSSGGTWHQREGLVGTATLRLESGASKAVRHAFATLARFAEYSGTGAQVTHGFGATKTTLLPASWSPAGGPPRSPEAPSA